MQRAGHFPYGKGRLVASVDEWALVVDAAGRPEAVRDRGAVLRVAAELGMTVAPAMVGCSVTRRDGDGYRTTVSASDVATAMDLTQYDAGAGPCLVAASEARPQRLDAADRVSTYPDFAAAAARHGVRSSLSLPLGGGQPAALNLYASIPAAFVPRRPLAVANLLARCLGALLDTGRGERSGPTGTAVPPADLADALARRGILRDAQDALMTSDQLSRAEAFDRLVRLSKAQQRSIFLVAADLLGRVHPGRTR